MSFWNTFCELTLLHYLFKLFSPTSRRRTAPGNSPSTVSPTATEPVGTRRAAYNSPAEPVGCSEPRQATSAPLTYSSPHDCDPDDLPLDPDDLQDAIDDLQDQIDTLENRLLDIDPLSPRYDRLQDRIDRLQERLDTLEDRQDALDSITGTADPLLSDPLLSSNLAWHDLYADDTPADYDLLTDTSDPTPDDPSYDW